MFWAIIHICRKNHEGKFVVVSIVVSNEQKDAVTVDASSFKLIDKDGREYSSPLKDKRQYRWVMGDAKGFLTKLNLVLQQILKYHMMFLKKLELSNISLKARGGMTGKEISLPLVVQKK